jgi:hypothetical protein
MRHARQHKSRFRQKVMLDLNGEIIRPQHHHILFQQRTGFQHPSVGGQSLDCAVTAADQQCQPGAMGRQIGKRDTWQYMGIRGIKTEVGRGEHLA